jgi:putative addiction module antidote
MGQKVIKVGNSLAVTIPQSFVKKANIKAGQNVYLKENDEYKTLEIHTDEVHDAPPSLTPEFKEWLDSFNKKYKTALRELAKK